jgi:hypothetical protein
MVISELCFDPVSEDIIIRGLRSGLRWRQIDQELKCLRGADYSPYSDLLTGLLFWSGACLLPSVTCTTCRLIHYPGLAASHERSS